MINKKLVPFLLTIVLIVPSVLPQNITINDTEIKTTQIEDNTYVPLRSLTDQLKESVGYSNGIATILKDGVIYAINISDKTLITSNTMTNERETGDIKVQIIDGVTYITLESFTDIFNVGASYNEQTGTINISSENKDTYSSNLKNNISELDKIIASTTDEIELAKLKEKRSTLYRTYLEYSGYVTFSGSNEEKKELIKNILEEVKNKTGSSLTTTKASPRSTSMDSVSSIGALPQLLGVYAMKGYDKQNGEVAYIANTRFKINGKYYGGSIDNALYGDGQELNRTYTLLNWDTDALVGRIFGSGYIKIAQDELDAKGYHVDTNSIKNVVLKTNIFGDYNLAFDENNFYCYGDPSYKEEVKSNFLNFIDESPKPVIDPHNETTGSVYSIDLYNK